MVKGSKIKWPTHKALTLDQTHQIQLQNNSTNPLRMEGEPQKVGGMFFACLLRLGGYPDFQAEEQHLQGFIANLPKCPEPKRTKLLSHRDTNWIQETTQAAKPTRTTGEDEKN